VIEREREEERWGGGSERHYRFGGGCNRNIIWQFESSQAVPASPCGRGEACILDLFNFEF
jgi:hypothetical protein